MCVRACCSVARVLHVCCMCFACVLRGYAITSLERTAAREVDYVPGGVGEASRSLEKARRAAAVAAAAAAGAGAGRTEVKVTRWVGARDRRAAAAAVGCRLRQG